MRAAFLFLIMIIASTASINIVSYVYLYFSTKRKDILLFLMFFITFYIAITVIIFLSYFNISQSKSVLDNSYIYILITVFAIHILLLFFIKSVTNLKDDFFITSIIIALFIVFLVNLLFYSNNFTEKYDILNILLFVYLSHLVIYSINIGNFKSLVFDGKLGVTLTMIALVLFANQFFNKYYLKYEVMVSLTSGFFIVNIFGMLSVFDYLRKNLIGKEDVKAININIESMNSFNLTEREKEIVLLISKGLTNNEISELTKVTPGTVRIHLYNIFKKMDCGNRVELVTKLNKR